MQLCSPQSGMRDVGDSKVQHTKDLDFATTRNAATSKSRLSETGGGGVWSL